MAKSPATPVPSDAPEATADGKGRRTPTRAEQEAARRRPLVPDTKEAKARARAELAERREKARIGMANGDDKYLPAKDKGPQRRFVRDYVDAGWHLGEAAMPALFVVLIATMLVPALQVWLFIGLWSYIALVIVDMVFTSMRVKRAAATKFGASVERGLGWYAAMRTVQMRWMRQPKAQVKRGQRPA